VLLEIKLHDDDDKDTDKDAWNVSTIFKREQTVILFVYEHDISQILFTETFVYEEDGDYADECGHDFDNITKMSID
jgi:hypothetical protein